VGKHEEFEKRQLEVLGLLSRDSLRYTALQTEFVKRLNGSPAVFNSVFYWLVKSGRIVKCGPEKLAPFRISDKGRKLLEALS
jgi:predicted transcriptional regulator